MSITLSCWWEEWGTFGTRELLIDGSKSSKVLSFLRWVFLQLCEFRKRASVRLLHLSAIGRIQSFYLRVEVIFSVTLRFLFDLVKLLLLLLLVQVHIRLLVQNQLAYFLLEHCLFPWWWSAEIENTSFFRNNNFRLVMWALGCVAALQTSFITFIRHRHLYSAWIEQLLQITPFLLWLLQN